MTGELSDEALIAAIQRKDVDALEVLYNRYRVLTFTLAVRLLGGGADAEDVVQEAFVNVWRSASTYRPERSNARSWLLSIVHHRAIDKLRSRRSQPQQTTLDESLSVGSNSDVWRDVAEKLTGEDVQTALQQLPPEQRETIELAYFKGYTHSQIADLLHLPLGTVKGRMRMGLHKLKLLLASSYGGLEQT